MTRFRTVATMILGLVMIAGCAPETQLIELSTGRSQVRDVVRAAAVYPDGSAIFETLEANYGFVGEVFHLEGSYSSASGESKVGFLDLVISVADGELNVVISDHDVEGLEIQRDYLDQALTSELDQMVRDVHPEEVLEYTKVEVLADNVLEIGYRLDKPITEL